MCVREREREREKDRLVCVSVYERERERERSDLALCSVGHLLCYSSIPECCLLFVCVCVCAPGIETHAPNGRKIVFKFVASFIPGLFMVLTH